MKKLFIIVLFAGLLISSCSNPCDTIDCGDNGTCEEGICGCDLGYEGTLCNITSREKFIKVWSTPNWVCQNSDGAWSLEILAGTNTNEVFLVPPGTLVNSKSIRGTVDGMSLDIPQQDIVDGVTFSYNGSGSITNGVFTFNLNSQYGSTDKMCSGLFN